MSQAKEVDVLKETELEITCFLKKLKELQSELKLTPDKYRSRKRAAVKRSALDLKEQLSKITTATSTCGTYYYKD